MYKLDHLDQQILNEIQHGFPSVSQPYLEIASKVGLSEKEAFQRVSSLRKAGFIRRLGGVFDSKKLGYVSTLCAVSIPEKMADTAAKIINQYQGVTHHYLRDHHYNLWFTIIAKSQEIMEETLSDIKAKLSEKTSTYSLISLPARKTFKLKVHFKI